MDLRALAKQLRTKEIKVKKVIFEFDEEEWVFENPLVLKADFMKNTVFQVFGNFKKVFKISEEDLKIVMEKTNCSEEKAIEALKKFGNIAEAILAIENGEI